MGDSPELSRTSRLWIVLGLNVALIAVLMAVGARAHSLAVLAEGIDYLADAAAIGVALVAIWLARRPPTPRHPRGFPKATAWAALVTGAWLLAISVFVAIEAVARLVRGVPEVHGLPVLIASATAALAMIGGALILGGDPDDLDDEAGTLNMRAVFLETAADAAIAGAVAVSGAIILTAGGLYWIDPLLALVVSAVVAYHAVQLLRRVALVLRAPEPTE